MVQRSPAKPCEQCGRLFEKPYTCSRAAWERRRFCSLECKARSQDGKFVWVPEVRQERPQGVPCRICGQPTRYYARRLAGLVHCEKTECAAASKAIKAQRSAATHRARIERGLTPKGTWKGIELVSREERLLEPWFVQQGWQPQLKVLTGVSDVHLPRFARVDFGLPERKLFVEIDGTSHLDREERDARRDGLLAAQGWRGLRITAKAVQQDPQAAKQTITEWLDRDP